MKLTVLDVINAIAPLGKMASADLPIAIALKLNDSVERLNKVLAAFEKKRKTIEAEFKIKGEDEVPKDKLDDFNAAVDKIADEEIDLDIKPFSIDDLEGVKLSSGDIKLVRWLIEAPE